MSLVQALCSPSAFLTMGRSFRRAPCAGSLAGEQLRIMVSLKMREMYLICYVTSPNTSMRAYLFSPVTVTHAVRADMVLGEPNVLLHAATVPLISTKTCNKPEVYDGLISSWMICAGNLEGGTDSCQVQMHSFSIKIHC